MSNYDEKLQGSLSDAAVALGRDRGARNESIADRITSIRTRHAALLERVTVLERALEEIDSKRPQDGIAEYRRYYYEVGQLVRKALNA